MGIEYYKYVWKNYKKQGGHKLVMLALAEFTNDDTGECWPSIATLAEMVCVSERQIQKVILDLKQSGDIEVDEVHGRNHTNTYRIVRKGELQFTFKEELKVNCSVEIVNLEQEKVNYSSQKVNYSTEKGELQFTQTTIEPEGTNTTTVAASKASKNGDGGGSFSKLRNRQSDVDYARVCGKFENNGFGTLTQIMGEEINALLDEYPVDWIDDAMTVSVTANIRNMRYVRGILVKWRANGRDAPKQPKTSRPISFDDPDEPEYLKRARQGLGANQ